MGSEMCIRDRHTAAFPDARGVPARRRNFTANPLGTLDDLHVVVEDGRIVAHAFLFALGVFFGGKVVPTGGIASVGVAPEARGLESIQRSWGEPTLITLSGP